MFSDMLNPLAKYAGEQTWFFDWHARRHITPSPPSVAGIRSIVTCTTARFIRRGPTPLAGRQNQRRKSIKS